MRRLRTLALQEGSGLRVGQEGLFLDLCSFWEAGHRSGYIKAPCGVGKDFAITKIAQALSPEAVLILVPFRHNVTRLLREFAIHAPELNVSPIYGEAKSANPAPVVISTFHYARAAVLRGEFSAERFPHQILNEGHLALGKKMSEAVDLLYSPSTYRVGFSATPRYDSVRNLALLLGSEIHSMTDVDAIRKGLIVPSRTMLVEFNLDLTDVPKATGGDYQEEVVRERLERHGVAATFAELYARRCQGEGAIFFTGRRTVLESLMKELEQRKVRAAAVTGATTGRKREKIFKQLERGAIDVVCAPWALSHGIHDPRIENVFIIPPIISEVRCTQAASRGTSINPQKPGKVNKVWQAVYVDRAVGRAQAIFSDIQSGTYEMPEKSESLTYQRSGVPQSDFEIGGVSIAVDPARIAAIQERIALDAGIDPVDGVVSRLREMLRSRHEIVLQLPGAFERCLREWNTRDEGVRAELERRLTQFKEELREPALSVGDSQRLMEKLKAYAWQAFRKHQGFRPTLAIREQIIAEQLVELERVEAIEATEPFVRPVERISFEERHGLKWDDFLRVGRQLRGLNQEYRAYLESTAIQEMKAFAVRRVREMSNEEWAVDVALDIVADYLLVGAGVMQKSLPSLALTRKLSQALSNVQQDIATEIAVVLRLQHGNLQISPKRFHGVVQTILDYESRYGEISSVEEMKKHVGVASGTSDSLPGEIPTVVREPLPEGEQIDAAFRADPELTHQCDKLLASLPERERRTLQHRFGFRAYGMKLASLGKLLDVSRERVRQLEAKGLRRLRVPFRAQKILSFVPDHWAANRTSSEGRERHQSYSGVRSTLSEELLCGVSPEGRKRVEKDCGPEVHLLCNFVGFLESRSSLEALLEIIDVPQAVSAPSMERTKARETVITASTQVAQEKWQILAALNGLSAAENAKFLDQFGRLREIAELTPVAAEQRARLSGYPKEMALLMVSYLTRELAPGVSPTGAMFVPALEKALSKLADFLYDALGQARAMVEGDENVTMDEEGMPVYE